MPTTGTIVLFAIIAAGLGASIYWYEGRPVSEGPMAAGTSIPFTELASGTDARVDTRVNYLITTDEELRDLWKLLDGASERPTIDFTRDAVLALFAGEEPTAGYRIAVSAITDTGERKIGRAA